MNYSRLFLNAPHGAIYSRDCSGHWTNQWRNHFGELIQKIRDTEKLTSHLDDHDEWSSRERESLDLRWFVMQRITCPTDHLCLRMSHYLCLYWIIMWCFSKIDERRAHSVWKQDGFAVLIPDESSRHRAQLTLESESMAELVFLCHLIPNNMKMLNWDHNYPTFIHSSVWLL